MASQATCVCAQALLTVIQHTKLRSWEPFRALNDEHDLAEPLVESMHRADGSAVTEQPSRYDGGGADSRRTTTSPASGEQNAIAKTWLGIVGRWPELGDTNTHCRARAWAWERGGNRKAGQWGATGNCKSAASAGAHLPGSAFCLAHLA